MLMLEEELLEIVQDRAYQIAKLLTHDDETVLYISFRDCDDWIYVKYIKNDDEWETVHTFIYPKRYLMLKDDTISEKKSEIRAN